ncbi:unnamed protein product [Paramecium primaurelia]|uniref:Exportin-2 central domain-containing protein n=1 Tax=Paramecium primaurelia TaxID=5886 RepID=A0A8S1N6G2_PARPR|nr:unnamed protein product [Paramecium primaurelia]
MIVTSNIVNDLNTAFQLINMGTNDKIRQGEQLLQQIRGDIQYPKVLFDYFQAYEISLGLRAAIELKLWFKEYRNFDDYQAQYVQNVVQTIKQHIISAYIVSEAPLIHQLKDAIVYVASRDFPTQWPTLMADLNQFLTHPDYVYKTLKLIYKLTEKYVYQSRSDPLYEEIIITCDTIHHNLLLLAKSLIQQIEALQNLKLSYEILKTLLKVFYNLNFQDLHPHFEDNLQSWMEFMKVVLRLQPVQGVEQFLFKCKGEALRCVLLYAMKYRDDFGDLIQVFSSEIWNVCTQTSAGRDSDKIVLCALRYFKTLIAWQDMKTFFEQNIKILIESLIIRNLSLSKDEIGMFQDEPQEFIEKFFEQSDLESRRAQAVELFKTVTKHFNQQVNIIIQEYLQAYIQSGMNGIDNEIILINLIIEASTSSFTSKDGTIDIILSQENVLGFYTHCLKPKLGQIFELQQQNQSVEQKFTPIQLAFYCRYLFYFRNVIDKVELPTLATLVSKLQLSKKITLSNIASYTAYSLINVRQDVKNYANHQLYFENVNISQYLQLILTDCYNNIKQQQKLETYSLKLTNSLITLLKQEIFNAIAALCNLLQDLLKNIKLEYEFQNVHLVFEIIASVVDVCIIAKNSEAANQLQQSILNQLDELLRENKGDVTNFVLQIYSLFLQVQTNASSYYQNLLQNFLEIQNWNESNSSLFQAYIIFFQFGFQGTNLPTTQLQAILKSIVSHSTPSYTELSKFLIKSNQQWTNIVLAIIFEQYKIQQQSQPQISSKSKATHLSQRLINKEVFLLLAHVFTSYGVEVLVNECSKISPQLLESFLINELGIIKSISQRNERKLIFTMLSAILFSGSFLSQQSWNLVFQAMVENITLKKRNPLKFMGRVTDREVTSSSGFQPLKPVIARNNNDKLLNDEDKLFSASFKTYYSNPIVQQQLPIQQLLTQQQQELLSNLIQSV